MMRALLLSLLLVLGGAASAAALTSAGEARARALQKELRCVVCQGESLDESRAPLAADLRRLIRQRIAAGQSDDQIKAFLVARYGDFILMKPPLQDDTLVLWFAPLGILLLGGGVALWVILRARARLKPDAQPPA